MKSPSVGPHADSPSGPPLPRRRSVWWVPDGASARNNLTYTSSEMVLLAHQ